MQTLIKMAAKLTVYEIENVTPNEKQREMFLSHPIVFLWSMLILCDYCTTLKDKGT